MNLKRWAVAIVGCWLALAQVGCGGSSSDQDGSLGIGNVDGADGAVGDQNLTPDQADTAGVEDSGADSKLPDDTVDVEPVDIALNDQNSGSEDALDPLDLQSDAPSAGVIYIYLKGDLTPHPFNDGLSGQTPTNYVIAISRYYIMKDASDPKPHLCFDHQTTRVEADMHHDNLVGFCFTDTVASASYTYGRVKVDYVKYSVQGTLHYGVQALPGTFTFFRAYSAGTYDGIVYQPGQGYIRYDGIVDYQTPYVFPQVPSAGNIKAELVNGEFLLTFPYTKPLPIVQNETEVHWARFNWRIHEAFRWKELGTAGYANGTWDVNSVFTLSEEVKMFGVSGYHITSSVD